MLLGFVHQVSETISRLDPIKDAPAFVDTWLKNRQELREHAFQEEADPEARKTMFRMFAAGALTIIKRMPEMIDVMVERINSAEVDPAVQCAAATVLAYVVQPRDLIPDDAPGGYGFVDDAILLHAGFLDILSMEPPHAERFSTQEEYLSFVSSFAPPNVMAELRQTVEGLEMTMAVFRMLPREALEVTTRIIIDEPLTVSTIPVGRGGENGFRSARFLEHAGEGTLQQFTHDGNKMVVQIPGGGIASDGNGIYQI